MPAELKRHGEILRRAPHPYHQSDERKFHTIHQMRSAAQIEHTVARESLIGTEALAEPPDPLLFAKASLKALPRQIPISSMYDGSRPLCLRSPVY